jgi:hypothetical protein
VRGGGGGGGARVLRAVCARTGLVPAEFPGLVYDITA